MKSQRRKIICFLLFLYSVSRCIAQDRQFPHAVGGVLDLRQENLFANQLALDGQWEFYWNELINPQLGPTGTTRYTAFPSPWKKDTIDGKPLPSQGYASYRLTVLLPRRHPRLAMRVPDVYSTYALYGNGELLSRNGRPGTTAGSTKPFWALRVVYFPSESDTLVLVLQVANFHHAKGGPYKAIILGDL
ncbi:MAG TPA: hypothetical protein VKR32_09800, partial [Puia sp.]|nr:hypothetical protein [Puia sp.]